MIYWCQSARLTCGDKIINGKTKQRMGVENDILNFIDVKCLTWYRHVRRWSEVPLERGGRGETK